jgi:hypothetical protein
LFATERGAKVRRQLIQEWEGAKDQMVSEGVLPDSQISIRQFIQNVFEDVFQAQLPEELLTSNSARRKAAKAPARKAKKSSKFSGV